MTVSPAPREQILQAMAEARWAQMNDAPWAEASNYARGHYIESATTQFDAALSVRVTCPTCARRAEDGERVLAFVAQSWAEDWDSEEDQGYHLSPCPDCGDVGTVPVLRMMED